MNKYLSGAALEQMKNVSMGHDERSAIHAVDCLVIPSMLAYDEYKDTNIIDSCWNILLEAHHGHSQTACDGLTKFMLYYTDSKAMCRACLLGIEAIGKRFPVLATEAMQKLVTAEKTSSVLGFLKRDVIKRFSDAGLQSDRGFVYDVVAMYNSDEIEVEIAAYAIMQMAYSKELAAYDVKDMYMEAANSSQVEDILYGLAMCESLPFEVWPILEDAVSRYSGDIQTLALKCLSSFGRDELNQRRRSQIANCIKSELLEKMDRHYSKNISLAMDAVLKYELFQLVPDIHRAFTEEANPYKTYVLVNAISSLSERVESPEGLNMAEMEIMSRGGK